MSDIVERLRIAAKHSSILRQSEQIVAEAADEIERLRQQRDDFRKLYLETEENFEKSHAQRGARIQIMREWASNPNLWKAPPWKDFLVYHPEAAKWFDEDGTPR